MAPASPLKRKTVGELIIELRQYDPGMLCLVDGYETGFETWRVEKRVVCRGRWGNCGGPWSLWQESDTEEVEQAVIVGRVEDSELGWLDEA